ncbi:SWIM zinc finger family protein [Candidatus Woesearchaeota archaeon]|nr:SWIM zinc finger family protein [Candidatus Woesearchaeota archaeon]
MRIRKSSAGNEIYLVESSTRGKYWKVNIEKKTCNCPHYVFRLRQKGQLCKHILAVSDMLMNDSRDEFEKAVDYVKASGETDSVELIEMFSEGIIDELIERGELIENRGKIRAT